MLAHMKMQTTGALTEIRLTVPNEDAERLCKAINGFLELANPAVRPTNEDGEELYSAREVFPDSTPGNKLRGLRTREALTQKDFAKALGIRQHHVSEMERGARSISVDMAKRIGETYNVSYKAFL
jgi:DNA-binding XRE family transcriptional regulator